MNKIKSPDYENNLNLRRKTKINQFTNRLQKDKFDISPAQVNTVNFYFSSERPHMRTAWEHQLGI